jgi:hypothetical protein
MPMVAVAAKTPARRVPEYGLRMMTLEHIADPF